MMNPGLEKKFILLFFLLLLPVQFIYCKVKLPKLISDGMVLQRDADIKIWGWADQGEKVTLFFNDLEYNTVADDMGNWAVTLAKMSAGGPYEIKIIDTDTIIIRDILFGDVWICSGQSNMELSMKRVSPIYQEEIANSENPNIRYFFVPRTYDFNTVQKDIAKGKWVSANSENVLNFAATAYFFGLELYNKYNVPIGLINSALGGSPAEAWMSEDALKEFPVLYKEAQRFKDTALISKIENDDKVRINGWYNLSTQKDEGYMDAKNIWKDPNANTSDWSIIQMPGSWVDEEKRIINGVIWFRKDIELPASIAEKPATLILGRIINADSTFVNGVYVGSTGYEWPPRIYNVPSGLLKVGKNTIVVRVISNSNKGGFVPDKAYELVAGDEKIDLSGNWQYKIGTEMEPLESETFIRWKPLGLYNAMISPLLNYRIKGVIWYQGEANTNNPSLYDELMTSLIQDWRNKWRQGDFPFLYVQLASFMETKNLPSESDWAMLREAQTKTLSVPNTGMAVTIDIGEWNDIHPMNKKDVGKRLALAAQKTAYDDNKVVYSGPIYKSMKIEGNKIILAFDHVGSGLISKEGKELKYFSIAGKDKQFVWARAKIENNKVVVWNENISNPVAVRYAWADNPEGANLFNIEGLPASPFRTDDWDK